MNSVAEYGIAAHWAYKNGENNNSKKALDIMLLSWQNSKNN
jgi:GTP pyrophosphokinase